MNPTTLREIVCPTDYRERPAAKHSSPCTSSHGIEMRRGGYGDGNVFIAARSRAIPVVDPASVSASKAKPGPLRAFAQGVKAGLASTLVAVRRRPVLALTAGGASVGLALAAPQLFAALVTATVVLGTVQAARLGLRSARKVAGGSWNDATTELRALGTVTGRIIMGRVTFGMTQFSNVAQLLVVATRTVWNRVSGKARATTPASD